MITIKPLGAHLLIMIMALCVLLYELTIASLLALIFGDVIFYFTLTIALFILFMGFGSLLAQRFISSASPLLVVEILISLLGAGATPIISLVAATTQHSLFVFMAALFFIIFIGLLAGAELPLLFKITHSISQDNNKFSLLLAYDYIGALLGSVLFALVLLPNVDLIGTGVYAGLLNIFAAIIIYYLSLNGLTKLRQNIYKLSLALVLFFCLLLKYKQEAIQQSIDTTLFRISTNTKIINNFRTKYQKVTLTLTPLADIDANSSLPLNKVATELQWLSIYLNNQIQAQSVYKSETDIYHHAFVHPAMIMAGKRESILILGGGDGLPAKEVQKYSDVRQIINVDLDGEWANFTKENPLMREHSHDSFNNVKLKLIIADAFKWVRKSQQSFDVILVDFPEGVDIPLARSYSLEFLNDLKRILNDDGVISFQVDTFNNPVYWSIVRTMLAAGYKVIPHHTKEPSAAEGLVLLSKTKINLTTMRNRISQYPFIRPELFISPQAMEHYRQEDRLIKQTRKYSINTFFNPIFLHYYRFSQY